MSLILTSPTAVITQLCADDDSFRITGYLPEYRVRGVLPENCDGLTHVIYFGVKAPADGRLPSPVVPQELQKPLADLRKEVTCPFSVSIGGWQRSAGFASLCADKAAMRRFIDALAEWCVANGFRGVDYDWEHPKGTREIELYGDLIAETCDVFHAKGLEVSVAQAGWQNLGRSVYAKTDRIHLMAYDHDYPHATLRKSTADVKNLIKWGCPSEKIILGVPFYGRNRQNQARSYKQLTEEESFGHSTGISGGFAFNGRATVIAKTEFAMRKKLGGIMIWEITYDSPEPSRSLLRAIHATVRKASDR